MLKFLRLIENLYNNLYVYRSKSNFIIHGINSLYLKTGYVTIFLEILVERLQDLFVYIC
jgi:hypothetical protein